MSQTRRLPVYLLLDVSGSMSGAPIQAVEQGVRTLVSELQSDPQALETAYLSVITFESNAQQIVPLTELMNFSTPNLSAAGGTSMGEGLALLSKCIDNEVMKTTPDQKGDWKPLVFLMTDGEPTDNWEKAADALKQKKYNVIACAAGAGANAQLLKRVTEIVVELDNLQPDDLKKFFKWVSSSIKATSASVAQVTADTAITLPPPPPGIQIIP